MKTVKQEIERILDTTTSHEASSKKYDVIVQVDTGFEKTHRSLMRQAVEAIRTGRTVVDPREIIPAVGDAFASAMKSSRGAPSASAKRKLRAQKSSLSAHTALAPSTGLVVG